MQKSFSVERDKGVKVAFSADCFVCCKENKGQSKSRDESPEIEKGSENKDNHPHKFQTVSKLIVGL